MATAQDYADTGDAATLRSANRYTDLRVTAWEQGRSEASAGFGMGIDL